MCVLNLEPGCTIEAGGSGAVYKVTKVIDGGPTVIGKSARRPHGVQVVAKRVLSRPPKQQEPQAPQKKPKRKKR